MQILKLYDTFDEEVLLHLKIPALPTASRRRKKKVAWWKKVINFGNVFAKGKK